MAIMGKLSEEDILVTFIYEKLRSSDITQETKLKPKMQIRDQESISANKYINKTFGCH